MGIEPTVYCDCDYRKVGVSLAKYHKRGVIRILARALTCITGLVHGAGCGFMRPVVVLKSWLWCS